MYFHYYFSLRNGVSHSIQMMERKTQSPFMFSYSCYVDFFSKCINFICTRLLDSDRHKHFTMLWHHKTSPRSSQMTGRTLNQLLHRKWTKLKRGSLYCKRKIITIYAQQMQWAQWKQILWNNNGKRPSKWLNWQNHWTIERQHLNRISGSSSNTYMDWWITFNQNGVCIWNCQQVAIHWTNRFA